MDYNSYHTTLKKIEFNLNYSTYNNLDKKNLSLIFQFYNEFREYKTLPQYKLNSMLYLFSNGNYFGNSLDLNYNEIKKNLSNIGVKSNTKINVISIEMLYDFYDFSKQCNDKNIKHMKFLCGSMPLCDIESYNHIVHELVSNYYKYMLEEILCEYRFREADIGGIDSKFVSRWYDHDLVSSMEQSLENLIELQSKYIFIKLSIFKISNEHILIPDIFNIIFGLSLQLN
jgi:hypothetical protein